MPVVFSIQHPKDTLFGSQFFNFEIRVNIGEQRQLRGIRKKPMKSAMDEWICAFLKYAAKKLEHPGVDQIIRINETNIISSCHRNAKISDSRQGPVFLMNDADPFISCCEVIADHSAAIRTSIINQDQFKICEGLRKNAFDTRSQILFYFENRD